MNRKHKKKLLFLLCFIAILGTAASLILYALKQNRNLFYTPSQLLAAEINPSQNLRLGGYVKKQSVQYDPSGTAVNFIITDNTHEIPVSYHGVLPNLFREGQGVVVTGKLTSSHTLIASEVLAKHDEKYMPWPLANELKKGNTP
jgi:cytochrome c-type biogenesis protein CcmE